MACAACGNKARRPMRSTVGKPVNQTQPARSGSNTNATGNDRGRSRVTGLRWNSK